MTVSRDYNCSDVKLLVVCATINESFLANKEPLIAVQSSWADPYGDQSQKLQRRFCRNQSRVQEARIPATIHCLTSEES